MAGDPLNPPEDAGRPAPEPDDRAAAPSSASGAGPPSAAPQSEPEPTEAGLARRLLAAVPSLAGLPAPVVALLGALVVLATVQLAVDVVGLLLGGLYRAFGELLPIVILAGVVAYLFDPLIDRFERNSWARSAAIAVCLGVVMLVGLLTTLVLVPYVVAEVTDLSANIGVYLARLGRQAHDVQVWLEARLGRPLPLDLASMQDWLPDLLPHIKGLAVPLSEALRRVAGSSLGALGSLVRWSLFPVLCFFFLRDWDTMKRGAFELLPMRARRGALARWTEIDQKLASFVRGQITVCLVLAVLYAGGLVLVTDIPLGALIGVLSGLLFIVPYLGTFLGIVAGSLMAALAFGASWEIVKVWAVFGVVQGIEGTLLTPKIVGDSVGLHPVVVILALFVGGGLFGFLGILLAVPAAAVLAVLADALAARVRGSAWFQQGAADAPAADELP